MGGNPQAKADRHLRVAAKESLRQLFMFCLNLMLFVLTTHYGHNATNASTFPDVVVFVKSTRRWSALIH